MNVTRRGFLAATGAAMYSGQAAAQHPPVKIGVDLYSIRLNNWTPFQYIDYLAKINVQLAHLSTTRELSTMLEDETALRRVRAYGEEKGVALELAMGSLCPTSREYDAKLGTPEQQIVRLLNAARVLNTRVVRTIMGAATERTNKEVPFEAQMENMARPLKAMRSRIRDSGVKFAVENHGGDFQSRELKAFVEDVGTDILGVCLDSGNPVWMAEDPHLVLEVLGPYALTTHLRDSAVWRVPEGVAVRWVRIGDGDVDLAGWVRKFMTTHPGMTISIENIVSPQPRILQVYDPTFWEIYPKMSASDLARFLALAEHGHPTPAAPPTPGKSPGEQQCEDLEASIQKLREIVQSA